MAHRSNVSVADDPFAEGGTLPETLPEHPWDIFEQWWTDAHTGGDDGKPITANPNAMNLATLNADGTPASRIVLCKQYATDADTGASVGTAEGTGRIVFYTNYEGGKGTQLAASPVAAACFHWDALDRQVRIEGPITQSPASESDAYFNSRHILKRLGAWASNQSRPVETRDQLLEQYAEVLERFNVPMSVVAGEEPADDITVPRPPHWGGFRLWARRVELWIGGKGRFHDRAEWTRDLTSTGDGYTGGPWSRTRLQP
ncbi:MAG: pyridoxal 5'-phosphate synthase [Planctomycetota bacterium]